MRIRRWFFNRGKKVQRPNILTKINNYFNNKMKNKMKKRMKYKMKSKMRQLKERTQIHFWKKMENIKIVHQILLFIVILQLEYYYKMLS